MILDISKWIKQSIQMQAKISHNDTPFAVRDVKKLPFNVKTAIKDQFSENFLNDADMVLFFKQPFEFEAKAIDKLFDLTNRALGKAANNMSRSDFKKLNLNVEVAEDDDENEEDVEDKKPSGSYFILLKISLKK